MVGSALEVYPVAGLPEETLAGGGQIAIVNKGPTPYDARAVLRIDGSAGEVLAQTVEALRGEQPQQPQHAS
jgi:NAD-dependent deacetylase